MNSVRLDMTFRERAVWIFGGFLCVYVLFWMLRKCGEGWCVGKLTFVETLLELRLWCVWKYPKSSVSKQLYWKCWGKSKLCILSKGVSYFFPKTYLHSSLEPGSLLSSTKEIVFQFVGYCIYTRWVLNTKITALFTGILYCVLVKQRWKADLTSIPKTDFVSIRKSFWCFVTNLF